MVFPSEKEDGESYDKSEGNIPQDIFRQLLLAPRYDRHFSREAHHLLGLLIVMRDGGETALEMWIRSKLGLTKDQKEEN